MQTQVLYLHAVGPLISTIYVRIYFHLNLNHLLEFNELLHIYSNVNILVSVYW
jgi:hypothetical protein